jgi:hypothetical protein
MSDLNKQVSSFSKGNVEILKLFMKYFKHIVIIVVVSGGLAILFSSPIFISPKYKSTAIIYPYNLIVFSDETEAEQLLQFANSEDVKEHVIRKHNLVQHYNIEEEGRYTIELTEEYNDNVTISRTELGSVKIEVLDTDPTLACEMVNSIIEGLNLKIKEIQQEKFHEYVLEWGRRLNNKEREIDSLNRFSDTLRIKYGLFDYDIQVEQASKYYYKTGSKEAYITLENLKKKGDELKTLGERLTQEENKHAEIKLKYEEALGSYNKQLTFTNIVSKPKIADKKSYPIRWLIVVVSILATLFFSITIFAFLERKNMNKSE